MNITWPFYKLKDRPQNMGHEPPALLCHMNFPHFPHFGSVESLQTLVFLVFYFFYFESFLRNPNGSLANRGLARKAQIGPCDCEVGGIGESPPVFSI